MKRILAAAAVTLLAVSATACGSGDGDSGDENQIVFSYWGSDSRQKLTEAAIAKFEEKYPSIKVEGDFSDFDSYYEKLATKTAAGDAPDVISIEIRALAEYSGRGTIADLTGKIDTTDLDQSVLKAGQVDGKQYAIPTGVNAFPMIVNRKAVAKAARRSPTTRPGPGTTTSPSPRRSPRGTAASPGAPSTTRTRPSSRSTPPSGVSRSTRTASSASRSRPSRTGGRCCRRSSTPRRARRRQDAGDRHQARPGAARHQGKRFR